MPHRSPFALLVGLLLLGPVHALQPPEADEVRERAAALRKEAAELAGQGRREEAERLLARAQELLGQAERRGPAARRDGGGGPGPHVAALQMKLEQLRAQERRLRDENAPPPQRQAAREAIALVERHLQAAHEGRPGALPPELAEAQRRLHHLRAAAENLKAAGAHDLAAQLMEKAEATERDLQQARARRTGEGGPHPPGGPVEDLARQVRELRHEVERLRDEVRNLKEQVQKRP